MKSFLILVIIVFILPFNIFSQGTVTNTAFYSTSMGMNKSFQIYLPEGYNPQDSTRYPVIYFLHGAFGNHSSEPGLAGFLNTLISNSTINPCIVIKPDGSSGPWAGSVYTNSELYGNFEDYIAFDLVEYIDSSYKTIPDKEKRAIMGLSMGAYGSMKLALKHPDIYCAVAAHSGPLDFNQWYRWIPSILNENGGVSPYAYTPTVNRIFTYFFYTAAGAFSPNLGNTPYPVDFLLDSLGSIIDSTFNKWLIHDPSGLARIMNQNNNLSIYFDCGIQDNLLLYDFNTAFSDTLSSLGINHIFHSYNGTHNNLINRVSFSLSFLDSVFKIPTKIDVKNEGFSNYILLNQNYPNPFNPNTKIKFTLTKSEKVKIEIFNMLGQKNETLLNEQISAGSHEIEFNARELPSGVYFYTIEAGIFKETKKMILLQ